ncbi:hypothetical protein HDV05_007459 [Chytridiales sp. JEL 0842]|nr:hypothetical protein HDV05_007459 [Chytridiales sp. JEL 0842]
MANLNCCPSLDTILAYFNINRQPAPAFDYDEIDDVEFENLLTGNNTTDPFALTPNQANPFHDIWHRLASLFRKDGHSTGRIALPRDANIPHLNGASSLRRAPGGARSGGGGGGAWYQGLSSDPEAGLGGAYGDPDSGPLDIDEELEDSDAFFEAREAGARALTDDDIHRLTAGVMKGATGGGVLNAKTREEEEVMYRLAQVPEASLIDVGGAGASAGLSKELADSTGSLLDSSQYYDPLTSSLEAVDAPAISSTTKVPSVVSSASAPISNQPKPVNMPSTTTQGFPSTGFNKRGNKGSSFGAAEAAAAFNSSSTEFSAPVSVAKDWKNKPERDGSFGDFKSEPPATRLPTESSTSSFTDPLTFDPTLLATISSAGDDAERM